MKKIILICSLLLIASVAKGMKLTKPQGITKTRTKLQQETTREQAHTKQVIRMLSAALYHSACAKDQVQQNIDLSHNFTEPISLIHKDNVQTLIMINRIQYQETALQRDRNLLFQLLKKTQQNVLDVFFDIALDSQQKNSGSPLSATPVESNTDNEPKIAQVVLENQVKTTKKYKTHTKTTSKKLKLLWENESVNVED